MLCRDFLECVFDAPDRPEQPDKGRDRADRGQNTQPRHHIILFTRNRDVHGPVDPALRTCNQLAIHAMGPAPFPHARNKDLFGSAARIVRHLFVDLIQGLAGPERILKILRDRLGAAEIDVFLDDDGPGPDRRHDQHDHDDLDRNRGP